MQDQRKTCIDLTNFKVLSLHETPALDTSPAVCLGNNPATPTDPNPSSTLHTQSALDSFSPGPLLLYPTRGGGTGPGSGLHIHMEWGVCRSICMHTAPHTSHGQLIHLWSYNSHVGSSDPSSGQLRMRMKGRLLISQINYTGAHTDARSVALRDPSSGRQMIAVHLMPNVWTSTSKWTGCLDAGLILASRNRQQPLVHMEELKLETACDFCSPKCIEQCLEILVIYSIM